MKKSLIITLAIVVVLVGAGVLVYNVFFKPKSIHEKDVTMTAFRWNLAGYDRYGRPLVEPEKDVSSNIERKIRELEGIIGNADGVIYRINPARYVELSSDVFEIGEIQTPKPYTFDGLLSSLTSFNRVNIQIIGKPVEKIQLGINDYLLLWDSFRISGLTKDLAAFEQIKNDKQESAIMNPLKGYDEIITEDRIYRVKLFQANKPGKITVDYNFISHNWTVDKCSIEVEVK